MNKIIFKDVGLSFGSQEIFKNLSMSITAGKIFGVTGSNGAGKSTLLKLAGKILKPDTGEVIYSADLKISAMTPEMKIYNDLTAVENLKFFSRLRGKNLSEEKIFELGERVGLDLKKFGAVAVKNFSTGMKQRLNFAILLSVDAEIFLLDEPTSNLDDEGRKFFYAEIKFLSRLGKIILLATNDNADLNICHFLVGL